MDEPRHFCSQTIQRLGAYAKWPGDNPRLPWHLDTSGYKGNLPPAALVEAFRLAWSWWAAVAEIVPVQADTASSALVRSHFARIDGPSGILAWSELADNTNQSKTQRYDASDTWIVADGPMQGGIDLARVMAHELGHALGLEHDGANADALMRPFISDKIRKPTDRDVKRLLNLGYKARTAPLPPDPDEPADPPPALPIGRVIVDVGRRVVSVPLGWLAENQ